jgi:hypothetical protein
MTVMGSCPFTLPLVAMIVALPAALPVTTPAPLTPATPVADELHEIVAPGTTAPCASRATAWNCAPRPTAIRLLIGDVTSMDDTTGPGDAGSPHATSAAMASAAGPEARNVHPVEAGGEN